MTMIFPGVSSVILISTEGCASSNAFIGVETSSSKQRKSK